MGLNGGGNYGVVGVQSHSACTYDDCYHIPQPTIPQILLVLMPNIVSFAFSGNDGSSQIYQLQLRSIEQKSFKKCLPILCCATRHPRLSLS